jgi:hypothetical protein
MNALLRTASAVLIVAACSVAAPGQIVTLGGSVTIKQADGTRTPAAGAVVDIYRTDIAQKFEARADGSGKYVRAGIPFVGTYTVAVSAPGAAPDFRANVRPAQTPEIDFVLAPGDGSRLTLEQIRGGANAAPPVETEADRRRRAEASAQNAEIEAANKKIVADNEIVKRAFDEGNAALTAALGLAGAAQLAKYDEAAARYEEGLKVRPDEPALLTNKSEALRQRGGLRFNAALAAQRGTDAARADASPDWRAAADSAARALAALKKIPAPTDAAQQAARESNLRAALSTRALALKLIATRLDQSQTEDAFKAYGDLLASETVPARKLSLRVEAAKIWFDVADLARAATELRKVLADAPANLDANLYLGMSLASAGDKASMKEGAIYLQRFLAAAPPNHPMRGDAQALLGLIKAQ